MTNNTTEAASKAINESHLEMIEFFFDVITRSGMDLSPCKSCDQLVISIPDGLALCKRRAEKAGE
jgi:hypothetical protein